MAEHERGFGEHFPVMVSDYCFWLQSAAHSHRLSPILLVHRPGATRISFFCPTLLHHHGNKWANIIIFWVVGWVFFFLQVDW